MSIITRSLMILIKIYQKTISPFLANTCCFYPSCSEYTLQALNKYGFWRGSYLGIKRIARCHPGSDCAVDELP